MVERLPERRGSLSPERFAQREIFSPTLVGFVGQLEREEDRLKSITPKERPYFAYQLRKDLHGRIFGFRPEEAKIFEDILDLFCLKHDLVPRVEEAHFLKTGGHKESKLVETAGPIGAGKSTLMKVLVNELSKGQANGRLLVEDYTSNVFWPLQKNPDYMLRSQLTFLTASINAGLEAGYHRGTTLRDSSTLSDIYGFMESYYQMGKLSQDEYVIYHQIVQLFKDTIRRPDLLIFFSVKNDDPLLLKACLETRIKDQPERAAFEKDITIEELKTAIQLNHRARKIIEEEWGVEILPLEVNPQEIYDRKEARYEHVYAVRSRLGLLKDLLRPMPTEVAEKTLRIFALNKAPQVVVIHSKSMFTGKTTVLCELSQTIRVENILAFQPMAALRYGEEQLTNLMTRDGRKVGAETIASNNLRDILRFIEDNNITPEEKPFVFIDEIMLFYQNTAEEAIDVLEALRKKGFNVVVDGITYTFQEKPFTFMHQLIEKAFKDKNWHELKMSTQCKYCSEQARGTRRIKVETGEIARWSDETYLAGDSNYEPVCCQEHKSCLGQPLDFVRQSLPRKTDDFRT